MQVGTGVLRVRDELGQAVYAIDLRLDYLTQEEADTLHDHYADHNRGLTSFQWSDVLRGPLADGPYETFLCRYDPANPPQIAPSDAAHTRWMAQITLLPVLPTVRLPALSAHWPMDEGGVLLAGEGEALEVGTDLALSLAGGTEVVDVGGGGHLGTASGDTGAMQAEGKLAGALNFDGADDYVNVPDAADLRLTEGGSIVAWINPSGLGEADAGRIADKSAGTEAQAGFWFGLAASNKLAFQVAGDPSATVSSASAIALSTWQLVGVSFGPWGRRLYVNGVDVTAAGGDSTGLPPGSTAALRIGNRSGAADRSFKGLIDDVRIYGRPLTPAEHAALYNGGSGTAEEIIP
jgi:hypothetical protein